MNIITPEAVHGVVNRARGTVFSYQGWPTVARDENGTLYAVASSMRVSHICPFGKTAMYISRDNGKTWTPPMIINDTYLDDRDAGILYMGNGRMLITWFTHPAEAYLTTYYDWIKNHAEPAAAAANLGMMAGYRYLPEEEKKGGSYVRISEDYGVTWSEKIKVPVSSPHGPNLCRDGSLIYLGKEMYAEPELPKGALAAYKSTDGGYTWEKLSELVIPEGTVLNNFHEPHVIELPDGRLFGAYRLEPRDNIKLSHFSIYTTVSEDGGKTWSPLTPTDVSGSPPHFLLHSSGALICTYGRREAPFGERAMVSWDLGKTWTDDYILDDNCVDSDLGYPSTVELDDGSLFTVYYQKIHGDGNKCSILYTNWKLK